MPNISNGFTSPPPSSPPLLHICVANVAASSSSLPKTLDGEDLYPSPSSPSAALSGKWSHRLRFPISSRGTCSVIKRERKKGSEVKGKSLMADHVRLWTESRIARGFDERDCSLPFLTKNVPKMVACRFCDRELYTNEAVRCSVLSCQDPYHRACFEEVNGKYSSSKGFKCLRHTCFVCKKTSHWRCVRCTVASHTKCAPWPNTVILLKDARKKAVCWRHHTDWRLDKKHADPTSDVKEAFFRLPLPYICEEFRLGSILEDVKDNKTEPAPYIHIRRNVYLVKRKRDCAEADVGCTNCSADSTCNDNCECRGLSVSCSKFCHCSDMCTNRPFRKEKKVKVIKTKLCGWGVEALEATEKGDFVIEYIGEVIDDALCEQRLWDMKHRGHHNFYMCEIGKDFTIDATFKGNLSRFLNHSCDPNCKLEKWQVDGETRVGVFAAQSIEVGEPLTYDYRFVHFGPMIKCCCGAPNCQGFLGSKRKIDQVSCWGCKKKRTTVLKVSDR